MNPALCYAHFNAAWQKFSLIIAMQYEVMPAFARLYNAGAQEMMQK
jgi:hypothetical protein